MIAQQLDREANLSTFIRRLLRLHELISAGKGDEEIADEVRDQMDAPWRRLSSAEVALTDGLSADLYSIGIDCPPRVPHTNGAATQEFKEAVARNNWPTVLEIVRREERDGDPFQTAFSRGVCWAHLQQPDVAVIFFREAQRIRALNPGEECWLLTSLVLANRSAEAVERANSILSRESDPLLMLKAAEVLSIRAAELDPPESHALRKLAIDAAQLSLARAEDAPPDELLTTLRIGVLRHLAINLAESGDVEGARRACDTALKFAPDNLDTAMLFSSLQDGPQASIGVTDIRRELPNSDASQFRQASASAALGVCAN